MQLSHVEKDHTFIDDYLLLQLFFFFWWFYAILHNSTKSNKIYNVIEKETNCIAIFVCRLAWLGSDIKGDFSFIV